MAFQFYVTIEGVRQGTFKGGVPSWGAGGGANLAKITGLAFNYAVTAARDAAAGQPSGKRQHSPVSFVKEWDAASPQLFQACCTNETLNSVLFEFVDTDAQGKEQVTHSIKLTNASISSMKFDIQGPAPSAGGTTQDLEEIAMVFQKIDIVAGEASASDIPIAGAGRIVTAGLSPIGGTAASDSGSANAGVVTAGLTPSPATATATNATLSSVGETAKTKVGGAAVPISSALGTVATRGRLAGQNRPRQ